jgi:hypothetical protein
LELGAQFIHFWSLGLNSTCKVFFQPFFLSCFFLNFFFHFLFVGFFKNDFSCFSHQKQIFVSFYFFKIHFFSIFFF